MECMAYFLVDVRMANKRVVRLLERPSSEPHILTKRVDEPDFLTSLVDEKGVSLPWRS